MYPAGCIPLLGVWFVWRHHLRVQQRDEWLCDPSRRASSAAESCCQSHQSTLRYGQSLYSLVLSITMYAHSPLSGEHCRQAPTSMTWISYLLSTHLTLGWRVVKVDWWLAENMSANVVIPHIVYLNWGILFYWCIRYYYLNISLCPVIHSNSFKHYF